VNDHPADSSSFLKLGRIQSQSYDVPRDDKSASNLLRITDMKPAYLS
jgi:hypothetical protein